MRGFSQVNVLSATSWKSFSTHFGHVAKFKTLLNIYLRTIEWKINVPIIFFRAKKSETSTKQSFLENRMFLMAALFRTVTFLVEELFWIKISTEKLLFRSRYSCTESTFSEELHLGKKLIFQKRHIPHNLLFWRATILEWLVFQITSPSVVAVFSEELLFDNVFFQKSYYFTVMLLFHSYTS